MNSAGASNFLKALGIQNSLFNNHLRVLAKQGEQGQEVEEQKGYPRPGTDFDGQLTNKKGGSRTDYVPPTSLDRVPLKARARAMTSQRTIVSIPDAISVMPMDRNSGHTVWRRYPNGQIDLRLAVSKLRESYRKYEDGAALNEFDALRLSSVFPEIGFENFPKEIVNIKAFLSDQERQSLRNMHFRLEEEESLRAIVDLGGA